MLAHKWVIVMWCHNYIKHKLNVLCVLFMVVLKNTHVRQSMRYMCVFIIIYYYLFLMLKYEKYFWYQVCETFMYSIKGEICLVRLIYVDYEGKVTWT